MVANLLMRRVRWAVAVAVAVWTASAGMAAASPSLPSQDPFYSPPAGLAAAPAGAVLRTRNVAATVSGVPAAVPATQVLYRTQNQLGEPSATAATIVRPLVPGPSKLVSYQTFYDGVGDKCRPSFTLQGGDPSNATAAADSALLYDYLLQGFTVVTADYEGPTDDYGAGRESGRSTLDAVRATQTVLGLDPNATPVGLVGYSGGAIASAWAAELQPAYAPELDLVGVAMGGIPADFAHNLDYINGTADWAGAIPAVGVGLARAYRLDFQKFLSDRGKQVVGEVSEGCLNPSAYPGLTFEDMLKPQYKDWKRDPELVRLFNETILGAGASPTAPLLMGVGQEDGIGDGVMIAKDVQQLAYTYCSRGASVAFREYTGSDHIAATTRFEPEALAFLQQAFAGQAPASECSAITPGNPLDPLPTPAAADPSPKSALAALRLRFRHGRLVVRATTGRVRAVRISIYRRRGARHKRVLARHRTLARAVTTAGVRLRVRGLPRGRYVAVARGRSGTARVRRALRFAVR